MDAERARALIIAGSGFVEKLETYLRQETQFDEIDAGDVITASITAASGILFNAFSHVAETSGDDAAIEWIKGSFSHLVDALKVAQGIDMQINILVKDKDSGGPRR